MSGALVPIAPVTYASVIGYYKLLEYYLQEGLERFRITATTDSRRVLLLVTCGWIIHHENTREKLASLVKEFVTFIQH